MLVDVRSRTTTAAAEPVFAEPLRFIRPTLPPLEEVLAIYSGVFRSGVITNATLVARLEEAVAERLGVRYCIAVSSCTSGLMLVLRAMGIAGEAILPSFTFFATGHAVHWNRLTPAFADCLSDTWTIDPASVEARINERTAAIVAVHLYGNPCAVEQLERIAARNRLRLVFDAAHAFGSEFKGRPVGQFGDAEVFSLSPTKLLVAGEGGLVTTNDAVLARRIRAARNYGDLGTYDPELLGLNARMSEFNAALSLAGLEHVDTKIRRHNHIAELYTSALSGIRGLQFQSVALGNTCTYKDYSVCIDSAGFPLTRDATAAALRAANIETKQYFYPPLHRQRLYNGYYAPEVEPLIVTDRVAGGILSLPIYQSLSDDTVMAVANALHRLGEKEAAHAQT